MNGANENNFVNNVASGNGAQGILIADGSLNQLKSYTTSGNGENGIGIFARQNTVKDNTASGNGTGIRLANGALENSVKNNTTQNNLSFDLADENVNCDNNAWMSNIFTTASQSCIQ